MCRIFPKFAEIVLSVGRHYAAGLWRAIKGNSVLHYTYRLFPHPQSVFLELPLSFSVSLSLSLSLSFNLRNNSKGQDTPIGQEYTNYTPHTTSQSKIFKKTHKAHKENRRDASLFHFQLHFAKTQKKWEMKVYALYLTALVAFTATMVGVVAPLPGQPQFNFPYVLPLASPLNHPDKIIIPPSSFGNCKWNYEHGCCEPCGPKPDFRSSKLPPGSPHPFPPGTPPEQNPSMYIHPAPTGANTGVTDANLLRFKEEDKRLNKMGKPVGENFSRMAAYNRYPTDGPFFTTQPGYLEKNRVLPGMMPNAGLPMALNIPERALADNALPEGGPGTQANADGPRDSPRDWRSASFLEVESIEQKDCVNCQFL